MTIQGRGARKGWTGTVLFTMGNTQRVRWEKNVTKVCEGEKSFVPLQTAKQMP